MMVPQHVTLIPVFIIIRGMGLYNNLGALIVPYATSVFGTFLLKQFFETIPDELEDAAKIDGAGFLQIYRSDHASAGWARPWRRWRFSPSTVPGITSFGR